MRPRLGGVTLTGATGTGVTVIVAEPLWPSLVAVTVAVPAATAVTRPVPLTVATAGSALVQVTTRSVSGFPAPSRAVAVSCPVWPTVSPRLGGVTLTVATGTGVTVIVAEPLWPSLVAVTVAVPAATAVTRPVPLTVATAGSALVQVTTRSVSGFPAPSRAVAVSCPVWPTVSPRLGGVTLTGATGTGVTVIVAEPLWPSLVAVTVAVPAATAVTRPVALTVATAGSALVQVTTRSLSGFPAPSRAVAVSCPVWPTVSPRLAGVTLTVATGTGVTVIAAEPVCPSLVAVIEI